MTFFGGDDCNSIVWMHNVCWMTVTFLFLELLDDCHFDVQCFPYVLCVILSLHNSEIYFKFYSFIILHGL